MWKRVAVGFFLALLFAVGVEGQAPTLGPTNFIGWDYTDAELATYAVIRFEAAYDGGPFTSVGMTVHSTYNGVTTYKTRPSFASGTHSITLRACNAVGCGTATAPFAFEVLNVPLSLPGNIRILIGG